MPRRRARGHRPRNAESRGAKPLGSLRAAGTVLRRHRKPSRNLTSEHPPSQWAGRWVPAVGFEPTRARARRLAIPLRLPVPPRRHPDAEADRWHARGRMTRSRKTALCRCATMAKRPAGGATGFSQPVVFDCGREGRRPRPGPGHQAAAPQRREPSREGGTPTRPGISPGLVVGGETTRHPDTCVHDTLGDAAESSGGRLVCPGRESNPHGLSAGTVSGRRVYQFHHPGTRVRTVVPAGRHDPPRCLRPAARNVQPPGILVVTERQSGRIGSVREGLAVPLRSLGDLAVRRPAKAPGRGRRGEHSRGAARRPRPGPERQAAARRGSRASS